MASFGNIGSVFSLIIFILLFIPVIWIVLLLFFRGKEYLDKGLIHLFFALIPITGYSYYVFTKTDKEQKQFVGIYHLTEYNKSKDAYLHLKEDNTFVVTKKHRVLETGDWHFESGSDFWIVYIGQWSQLGSGNYEYDAFKK